MKQCPRCASEINDFDRICPRCGLPIEENSAKNQRKNKKLEKKRQKKLLRQQKKLEKQEKFKIKTNFEDFKKKELMTKKQAQDALEFDVNEKGEYVIDTDDVALLDQKTKELLAKREKQTYSVKKARGEYEPEKIRWWELYKLANRAFERRKIKKEVNKAAKIRPEFVSKSKLLLLAIFFGWCGVHNFYVKNNKKGWVGLICLILWFGIVGLAPSVPFFASIQISIGGGTGFVVLIMWLADIINIICNNFKYRLQKIAFISRMNVETRAKLGEKYIDMDLYQKPWWVRFKVWCSKMRKNYAEYKHERRQKMIEKEKLKQAEREKQAQIDAEIAAFEEKENENLKKQKILSNIDQEALNNIKEIADETQKQEKENVAEIKHSKPRSAKVRVSVKNNKKNKK